MSETDPYKVELAVDLQYDWEATPPTANGVVLVNDHAVWSTRPANLPEDENARAAVLNGLLQTARDRLASKLRLLLN